MQITDDTPISFLTVKQLKEILNTITLKSEQAVQKPTSDPEEYVYGYQGLRDLLKISSTKVWQLKKTILKPAIIQYGRRLMIHKETALKLLAESKERGHK